MKHYKVITIDKTYLTEADKYEIVREKGGFIRYDFIKDGIKVATFRAGYVDAILEV